MVTMGERDFAKAFLQQFLQFSLHISIDNIDVIACALSLATICSMSIEVPSIQEPGCVNFI